MDRKHWITILFAILAAIGTFAAGRYIGANARHGPAVEQGPTRFFAEFDPQKYLEAATKGEVTWKVVSDQPVTGEHYGNPPHSRAYARRKTRLVATVTPEQWAKLKSDYLHRAFMDQGKEVEKHGEDQNGGEFTIWSVPADPKDDEAATRYGFGHRYYGGKRGIGSHHGLFTFTFVKAGDQVEILFFIWESWPRD